MLGKLGIGLCLLLVSLTPFRTSMADPPVTIFAAASLTDAFEEVGTIYQRKTGKAVRFSFASSSTLARQIEAGAPAQIFASANEEWMTYLDGKGLINPETRTSPIRNRLVLVTPADSPLPAIEISPACNLPALLHAHERLAVGDPEHVPAGIYAKQALVTLGFWHALEPRLARTDNVRAALALVERGEAPLGIVYETDTRITPNVKILGAFPAGSHTPITYPFAHIKAGGTKDGGTADSAAFFAFLLSDAAMSVFERHGFTRVK